MELLGLRDLRTGGAGLSHGVDGSSLGLQGVGGRAGAGCAASQGLLSDWIGFPGAKNPHMCLTYLIHSSQILWCRYPSVYSTEVQFSLSQRSAGCIKEQCRAQDKCTLDLCQISLMKTTNTSMRRRKLLLNCCFFFKYSF